MRARPPLAAPVSRAVPARAAFDRARAGTRARTPALVAGALLLAVPLGLGAMAAGPAPDLAPLLPAGDCVGPCPDLVPDPAAIQPSLGNINYGANHCAVQEGMTPPGPQRVVRLTTSIVNLGPGHFTLGSPSANPDLFYWSECHRHWHTRDYADYRVWTPAGWAAWTALRAASPGAAHDLLPQLPPELQPVTGGKQGFCVIDVRNYIPGLPRAGFGCGHMGISSGWGDVYSSGITGQWVVITGVPAGQYVLEIEINAQRLLPELEYANNSSGVPFQIT